MIATDEGNTDKGKAAPAPAAAATMTVTIKEGQGQITKSGVTMVLYGVHEEEGPYLNVVQGSLNNIYALAGVSSVSIEVCDGCDRL